jgi:transcription elongation GreA/GreB family factor
MAYRFLRKDYDALLAKIEELAGALREAGQEKGLWANQSAETWHDNFGYEQEQRQEWVLSDRLDEFVEMKNDAEIVQGRAMNEVDIGCRVTIRDTESDEQRTFMVGSYQVLDQQQEDEVSYAAPLAKPFMGATVIPSSAGEGIAIALRSARHAADAVLAGDAATSYVAAVRRDVLGPMRRAGLIESVLHRRPLRQLGLSIATVPGFVSLLARLTRLTASPA